GSNDYTFETSIVKTTQLCDFLVVFAHCIINISIINFYYPFSFLFFISDNAQKFYIFFFYFCKIKNKVSVVDGADINIQGVQHKSNQSGQDADDDYDVQQQININIE
ncbi:hypothetical protein L9F63_027822, partial [Diploptera punctata]